MPFPALAVIGYSALTAAIYRIITAIGIGVVSYTVVLPNFYSYISGLFSDLPLMFFQMAGLMRIDICVTLVLSAYAARMTYKVALALKG